MYGIYFDSHDLPVSNVDFMDLLNGRCANETLQNSDRNQRLYYDLNQDNALIQQRQPERKHPYN